MNDAVDFRASVVACAGSEDGAPRSRFEVANRGKTIGRFELHVPGQHNVLNATAAVAAGIGLDVPADKIAEALSQFRGVDRRFQIKGKIAGVTVVDDYGHHPTEIRATLAAARQCGFSKANVIFQPHRYTRTRDLAEEFATAFRDADAVEVLDIYAASEEPIDGVTAEDLADRIRATGANAEYCRTFTDAAVAAASKANDGDVILTLGAGSVYQIGPMVLNELRKRSATRAAG
jgi:UDP-N-acetylmuramate--alanine ligase